MAQIVTRVDDELVAAVDELVDAGAVSSRSDAVRIGLRTVLDVHRRQQVGQAIRKAYERCPQTDAEIGSADAATVAMIAEEPW